MGNKIKNQQGFTIIELLISTAILSTMLVMATFIMMSIGNLYYKGINQSKIQNNVRNIVQDISDQLQTFDQDQIPAAAISDGGKTKSYCINGIRYTFRLGYQLKDTPSAAPSAKESKHVLWRDSAPGTCQPADGFLDAPSTPGTEMMTVNSRLTQFDITNTSPFNIKIGAAYGDKDLLVGEVTDGGSVACTGGSGDSFCAVSYLSTSVARRLGR